MVLYVTLTLVVRGVGHSHVKRCHGTDSLSVSSLILNFNIHNMSSSPAGLSPRVNSARLQQYERQEVWLPCKPIKVLVTF